MKIRNLYQQPGEVVRNGTLTVWRLLGEDDFVSNLSYIVECLVEAGITLEPHDHTDLEEVYYILHGIGEMRLGDETEELGEGDAVYVPPRVIHTIRNTGSHPLQFACVGVKTQESSQ